ncbi:Hypothetical protein, putative [Bodo saltans]|uniref:Reverse transcriptase domain-containing protein n=1 Tax=Bodo saltans TaxID=75058 RepID=A0A0S4J2L7_BODSA|nr:Hypothetical protein, putative [Bodo saltans]|eukprot:CUG85049.1 Hypothetical protein, putative [Bodo saltans]
MGFRPSCGVAQRTIEFVCAIDGFPGVTIFCYIDNILISGDDKAEVAAAAAEVRRRCDKVGIQLNALPSEPTTKIEFLGEVYDTSADSPQHWTRTNTDKTLAKLRAARQAITTGKFSCRRAAAVFGALLFASRVAGGPLAQYFNALRYLRSLAAAADGCWNRLAPPLTKSAYDEILTWLDSALKNEPYPLKAVETQLPATKTIYVDASATGWGAHVITEAASYTTGARWSPADHMRWNLRSSVAAEPLALRRSLRHAPTTRWWMCIRTTPHLSGRSRPLTQKHTHTTKQSWNCRWPSPTLQSVYRGCRAPPTPWPIGLADSWRTRQTYHGKREHTNHHHHSASGTPKVELLR